MPTSREIVANKALAGPELSQILLADFARMLTDNGILTSQMAFPRVAYEIRLTLHLDIPSMPTVTERIVSQPVAIDKVAASPDLAAIEPLPLAEPSNAMLHATELARDIQSPNLARVEHGLPIEVTTMGQDGHVQERLVEYAPVDVGMTRDEFPLPDLSDVTEEQRRELGL